MSATRTQIYLSEHQRQRIDDLTRSEGISLAEVVRRALDAYLPVSVDPTAALAETFGADPDAQVPDRADWDRG